jgi:hypothetical protein
MPMIPTVIMLLGSVAGRGRVFLDLPTGFVPDYPMQTRCNPDTATHHPNWSKWWDKGNGSKENTEQGSHAINWISNGPRFSLAIISFFALNFAFLGSVRFFV